MTPETLANLAASLLLLIKIGLAISLKRLAEIGVG